MALVLDLQSDLLECEGKFNVVYDDATGKPIIKGSTVIGNPTIGIGRCLSTKGITDAEISSLLDNDITSVLSFCARNFPFFNDLSNLRQRALANMVFQLGGGGVLGFKNMLGFLESGNYSAAAAEVLNSTYAKQTPKRAQKIAAMISEG